MANVIPIKSWEEQQTERIAAEKVAAENYRIQAYTVALILGGELQPPNPSDHGYNNYFPIVFDNADIKGCISLAFDKYHAKGRVEVSGSYATDLPYRETAPRITISADKDAPKIALDIQRRFMPEYIRLQTECLARKAQHDAYVSRKEALVGLLVIPGQTSRYGQDGYNLEVRFGKIRGTIERVDANDNTATLTRDNLKVAQITRILQILRDEPWLETTL
jgi:hypothetical protein